MGAPPTSLLLTSMYPPRTGGVARMLGRLAERFPEESLLVLAPGTPFGERLLNPHRAGRGRRALLGLLRRLSPSLARTASYLPATLSAIRFWPVAVLQCGHLQLGATTWLASRLRSIPYVVYAYGDELLPSRGRVRSRLGARLSRAVLRRAAAVFVISEYTRGLVLRRGVPEDRIFKIPMGAEVAAPAAPGVGEQVLVRLGATGRPLILSVGRLIRQKGHDQLLRALPPVLAEFQRAVCVIVGQGPEEAALRSLARTLGIGGRVRITGFVSDEDLAALYEACDLFVLLSRDLSRERKVEGFGLVFLEAAARGKPAVGGATGGVPDAVLDGVTGRLVDPDEPIQATRAILELLRDKDSAHSMGAAARKRVLEELNWSRSADQVMSVVQRIASEGTSGRRRNG